ncbi:hypothetical protein D3C85_965660 [compost metagenome]
MARQPQRARARIALVARVDVIEQQVIARQAAHHVRRGEVQRVVVVEQRPQGLARVADMVLQLVVARIDVWVEMILERAARCQGGTRLGRAVVIAREPIALRSSVGVVQVDGNLRRAKAHMIRRQLVTEAHDDRLAIAGEDDRTRYDGPWRVAFETKDTLRRIGGMEHPVEPFLDFQLIKQGLAEHAGKFSVALVRRPPGFATGNIRRNRGGRGETGDRLERGDRVGQRDQPRRGRWAGREHREGCGPALARFQQYRRQHGGGADFEEGASAFDSIRVLRGRQATFPVSQVCGFHCGPSLSRQIAVRWLQPHIRHSGKRQLCDRTRKLAAGYRAGACSRIPLSRFRL